NTVHLAWFDQRDNKEHPLEAEKKLDAVMKLLGLPVEPVPSGKVMVPNPEVAARRRAEQKLRKVHGGAPAWARRGGDQEKLRALLQEFEAMGKPGPTMAEADKKLDEALRLLGRTAPAGPAPAGDPEALRRRMEVKVKEVQARAPAWVRG